jgi:hypothetical protein
LRAGFGWNQHIFNESEMALFFECMLLCAQKVLDTADIVREAIFQQLTVFSYPYFDVLSDTTPSVACVPLLVG